MNTQLKRAFFFMLFTAAIFKSTAQNPKLIEFGWDAPNVDQLSKGLPKMQNTPFDGICFKLQKTILEAFDTIGRDESYFQYDKLKALQWGKYTDNFIILRGFGITGGRWFNDTAWQLFTANMKALSKALAVGNLKGIFFDPEYYYPNTFYNPWTYIKTQYPNQSLEEVQSAVKKRGAQFISALQSSKPDLIFLSIWITSLIVEDLKTKALPDTRHVLLIAFIEGVLEGKNSQVKVIDGNEYGYWFKNPSQFMESAAYLKKNTIDLMKSKKAKAEAANMSIAQPLFYDGLMAKVKTFEKGYDNTTKWNWLQESAKYALASTSNYVWLYSQSLQWWQEKVNDTLVQILQNSKNAYNTNNLSAKNYNAVSFKPVTVNNTVVNDGNGYYYFTDPKTPMKTGDVAFSFKWAANTKKLQINFAGKTPKSLAVYANNTVQNVNAPIETNETIKLKNFLKGKLIILAKYDDNREATGIKIYKGK